LETCLLSFISAGVLETGGEAEGIAEAVQVIDSSLGCTDFALMRKSALLSMLAGSYEPPPTGGYLSSHVEGVNA
jgi:hypothetical protein